MRKEEPDLRIPPNHGQFALLVTELIVKKVLHDVEHDRNNTFMRKDSNRAGKLY